MPVSPSCRKCRRWSPASSPTSTGAAGGLPARFVDLHRISTPTTAKSRARASCPQRHRGTYAPLIEALYSDAREVEFDAPILYEDGRRGRETQPENLRGRTLMDATCFSNFLAINGVFVGLMYALVAAGIVLIYKTSGIANLAQGALAMMAAISCGSPARWGLPMWAGAPSPVWRCSGWER